MKVAVMVAMVTIKTLAALTDTSKSSTAKRMPPSGALKVAAMPAPAPAAMSTTRWRSGMVTHWPSIEPKVAPIWMIGPSRPTEAAAADGDGRGQGLDDHHHRPDAPVVVVDGVHHLGDAVALGFRCEGLDQPSDRHGADHRHGNHPNPPDVGRGVLVGVVVEGERAQEEEVVKERDQQAKDPGPQAGDHTDRQCQQAELQHATRLVAFHDIPHQTAAVSRALSRP